jgi:D-arabinose 1-dehydrogenase-like Zn-dependent alcohol dehydrogenase
MRRVFWNHLKIFGSTLGSRKEFRQLLTFMNTVRLRPILDQMFPLKDIVAAHQRLEQGRQFGKIVLQPPSI